MRFSKMHGAGNDFVVLDLRDGSPPPSPALAARLADRHFGVGCDQILTIETACSSGAVASYRIWNADGSSSGQCGNGARCVAAWLLRDGAAATGRFRVDSPSGIHEVQRLDDDGYAIAMGVPRFEPAVVPLSGFSAAQNEYQVEIDGGRTLRFGAVSMGNPHAVIEAGSVDDLPLETLARQLQDSAWFPQSVNVGLVEILSPARLRLRVHERGVGETLACGTGACAAAVVLMRRGKVARRVTVSLPGGDLQVSWPDDAAEVILSGPAAFVFEGEWTQ